MTGTEKQVAYAQDIIDAMIGELKKSVAKEDAAIESAKAQGKERWVARHEYAKENLVSCITEIESYDAEAEVIIRGCKHILSEIKHGICYDGIILNAWNDVKACGKFIV